MIILTTGVIGEEELKLLGAIHVISEYHLKHQNETRFEELCTFLKLLLEGASAKQDCPKCGHQFDAYVPNK